MDRTRRQELLNTVEKLTELPLLVLALAMIPLVVLPFVLDLSPGVEDTFFALDWFIWAVFAADLGVRTYLSEARVQYLRRNWLDVIIVVVPMLRPLRALRAFRVLRAVRIARLIPLIRLAIFSARAWTSLRHLLGIRPVVLAALVMVLACAALVALFESGVEGSSISGFDDALWWAVATISTVGYGDEAPTTPEGRAVGFLLIFTGIAFFSVLTANLASFLTRAQSSENEETQIQALIRKIESLEAVIRSSTITHQSQTDATRPAD
jgi:voltage-gated potassium channel